MLIVVMQVVYQLMLRLLTDSFSNVFVDTGANIGAMSEAGPLSISVNQTDPSATEKVKPKRASGGARRKLAKQKAREMSVIEAQVRAIELTPPTEMPTTLSDVAALARWVLISCIKGHIPPEDGARFCYMASAASKLTEAEQIQELARLLGDQAHQDGAGAEFTMVASDDAGAQS